MKKLFLLLATVGMIFTACENFGIDDPQLPQIEVVGGEESLTLNFPSEGALAKTVTFNSNYDWSVTTSEAWIKVSPESGEAGEECLITVSLDRNDSGVTRNGKVTISIDRLSIDLAVTQLYEGNTAIIPNDEIWYTSSDSAVIEPYATDVFGAKIVSNICENGKGIIAFDAPISQIGAKAFYNCATLTRISIPNTITEMNQNAFYGCKNLKRVDISDLSAWCKIIFSGNNFSNPLSNGADLYLNEKKLTDIAIPSDITKLNNHLFYGCTSLKSVIIPHHIISIGHNAFYNCSLLTDITIEFGVTSIGNHAFNNCSALTEITIPGSITSLSSYAFVRCHKLEAFYGEFASSDNRCLIMNGVLKSFAPAGLTEYSMPKDITSIGNGAFWHCSSLINVTIPNSVTSIGQFAFSDCISLKNITLPNSVTRIRSDAFLHCISLEAFYGKFASSDNRCLIINGELTSFAPAGLTKYTIPNSVTSVRDYAFRSCVVLESVIIPNSVKKVGIMAFTDCKWLKSVYCKATTPPTGGSNMFYNNAPDRKIYVPRNSVEAYKKAKYWSDYADYIEGYDF